MTANDPPRSRSGWTLALASVLFALPTGVQAQDTEWNRYTLEGLAGLYVRAEASEACAATGVDAANVKAEAEAALFEAVPLLTEREMLETPGLPELRITLECAPGEGSPDVMAFSVSVRVQQSTKMIRDEQITLAEAVTWWSTSVGAADVGDAASALTASLNERLQQFAEAFEAANGEGGPG